MQSLNKNTGGVRSRDRVRVDNEVRDRDKVRVRAGSIWLGTRDRVRVDNGVRDRDKVRVRGLTMVRA